MKRLGPVPALALLMLLAACQAGTGASASATGGVSQPSVVATPAGSPGIVLRQAPANLGCDSIGWEGEPYRTLTFHVDPDAPEHVWAESDTGATLTTQWSEGFQAGTRGGARRPRPPGRRLHHRRRGRGGAGGGKPHGQGLLHLPAPGHALRPARRERLAAFRASGGRRTARAARPPRRVAPGPGPG